MTELNLPPGVPVARMAEMQHFAQSIGLVLSTRCHYCGAPLWAPASLEAGAGPVCRRRHENDPSSTVAKQSAAEAA